MYIKDSDGWRGTALTVQDRNSNENAKTDQQFIKINGRWVGMPRNTFEWIQQTMPFPSMWNVAVPMEGKFMAISENPNTISFSGNGVEWDHEPFDLTRNGIDMFVPTLAVEQFTGQHPFLFMSGIDVYYTATGHEFGNWDNNTLPFAGNWIAGASSAAGTVVIEGFQYDEDGAQVATDRAVFITDEEDFVIQLPSKQFWVDVHYSEERGYFVAIAKNSDVNANSLDGINWTEFKMPRVENWVSIAYGSGVWVAIAEGDVVAYSNWAQNTWVEGSNCAYAPWTKLVFKGDRFLAIASPHVDTVWSRDGVSWERLKLPGMLDWRCLTFLGSKYLAVAANSDMAATLDFNEFGASTGNKWPAFGIDYEHVLYPVHFHSNGYAPRPAE